MLFVDNRHTTDPHLNLALEEFLLRQAPTADPLLLLYVNEPSVIIGRNQNVWEELDPTTLRKLNIHLVRRLSGGGTVFHDLGNLNYSFICQGQQDLHKFERITKPIINALGDLGVDAELRGRSDIVVDGKKISGNAQYASRGRMFSHGTLLFDADLAKLYQALKPRDAHIESKAVQSVRSSVRNLKELLPAELSIADLRQAILAEVFGQGRIPTLELTDGDWEKVERIAAERYRSWDWNIGRSPRFTIGRSEQYPNCKVEVRAEVEKGVIKKLLVTGDCWPEREASRLEAHLSGVRYDADELLAALLSLEDESFFVDFSREAFVDLIY